MSELPVWTVNENEMLTFEKWLTSNIGVSNDCFKKLSCYGCNSIQILKACTESDIEDISNETNIKKIDKLKLKVAIRKFNEENININDENNNKHLIIEMEERNIMINIDNKIKEFQNILKEIDSNQLNHIIVETQKCEKEINDTFETIYNSLKQRKEFLLTKLHKISNEKKCQLIKTKKYFNSCLEKSFQIKQECHKLLNKPTEIEQLNDRKQKLGYKANKVIGIKYDEYNIINKQHGELFIFKSYLNSLLKIHNKFGDVYGIKYVLSDKWDMNNKGDNILVNNKICHCDIDNEYQSVFGLQIVSNGIHHWRLKIIKTTYHMLWNTMIGILQINKDENKNNKKKVRNTYFTENGHSFSFIGNCSALEPNINIDCKNIKSDQDDEDDQVKYGQILKNGSIIDVIFDGNKHTLKYKIDGIDFGIAYQRIPVGKYCLAVTMTQKNDQMQLISYCGQQFV